MLKNIIYTPGDSEDATCTPRKSLQYKQYPIQTMPNPYLVNKPDNQPKHSKAKQMKTVLSSVQNSKANQNTLEQCAEQQISASRADRYRIWGTLES